MLCQWCIIPVQRKKLGTDSGQMISILQLPVSTYVLPQGSKTDEVLRKGCHFHSTPFLNSYFLHHSLTVLDNQSIVTC